MVGIISIVGFNVVFVGIIKMLLFFVLFIDFKFYGFCFFIVELLIFNFFCCGFVVICCYGGGGGGYCFLGDLRRGRLKEVEVDEVFDIVLIRLVIVRLIDG